MSYPGYSYILLLKPIKQTRWVNDHNLKEIPQTFHVYTECLSEQCLTTNRKVSAAQQQSSWWWSLVSCLSTRPALMLSPITATLGTTGLEYCTKGLYSKYTLTLEGVCTEAGEGLRALLSNGIIHIIVTWNWVVDRHRSQRRWKVSRPVSCALQSSPVQYQSRIPSKLIRIHFYMQISIIFTREQVSSQFLYINSSTATFEIVRINRIIINIVFIIPTSSSSVSQ